MAIVEMRDLALSVRGASSSGSGPPPHIWGMVSSVRSAIRVVHATSPAAGVAKVQSSLGKWLPWAGDPNRGRRATASAAANYIAVVEQCASWHAASPLAFTRWEERGVVSYGQHSVEVLVRVVLESSTGVWGRLILWDSPPLTVDAAELMASPVVELLDSIHGPDMVQGAEVWQCRTGETHTITARAARLKRNAVAAHLSRL